MTNDNFKSEVVKKSSTACEGLLLWVLAMEKYNTIYKVVGPLETKLNDAKTKANALREKLETKQNEVREVSWQT